MAPTAVGGRLPAVPGMRVVIWDRPPVMWAQYGGTLLLYLACSASMSPEGVWPGSSR